MEQSSTLPARLNLPPEQLSEPLVKAYFNKQVLRKDYQKTLQSLELVIPTKDNLPQCKETMKSVKKVITDLLDFAKDAGAPYFKAHKVLLKSMNDVLEPILSKVSIIDAEIESKNNELLADLTKARAEQFRISNIKQTMVTFINSCTAFISTASTSTQIVNVQKRIGAEKSKKNFYAEFINELIDKTYALDTLIEERKEYIRKEAELYAAALVALTNDDTEAAADIKEQQQQLETDMEENIIRLQEEAFQQISNDESVYVPEPAGEALKGRNYWRWEVDDLHKLYKRRPDLVILTPNKEAIDQLMSANRDQWNKDGKKEAVVDTIKFFIKKFL